jgi:signal transduction histidine kinase
LLPAVIWLVERYTSQTGIHIHLKHSGLEQRFHPDIETTAYRVVQEALTNIARHAGVKEADVCLKVERNTLYATINDQGIGFEVATAMATAETGGLSGMHERVSLSGGKLTVESNPGAGTCLTAEWPLP